MSFFLRACLKYGIFIYFGDSFGEQRSSCGCCKWLYYFIIQIIFFSFTHLNVNVHIILRFRTILILLLREILCSWSSKVYFLQKSTHWPCYLFFFTNSNFKVWFSIFEHLLIARWFRVHYTSHIFLHILQINDIIISIMIKTSKLYFLSQNKPR